MSYLVVPRPSHRTVRLALNFCLMAGVSFYFLVSYQRSGWTYDIVCGVLFAIWALYIGWAFLRRRIVFREDATGFQTHKFLRFPHYAWSDLVAIADQDAMSRILFLAAKRPDDGKEVYIGVARAALGEDGFAQVADLIKAKRPDLRRFADGKVLDEPARFTASD